MFPPLGGSAERTPESQNSNPGWWSDGHLKSSLQLAFWVWFEIECKANSSKILQGHTANAQDLQNGGTDRVLDIDILITKKNVK